MPAHTPTPSRQPRRRPHSPWSLPDDWAQIDARLATLGRGLGAMRLRIGEGLSQLEAMDGVRRLGFPGLEAYAREALGRSGRWGADVRSLARRLSALPRLRCALVTGALSISMVELVARVALPVDDGAWVERAKTMTVREMRAHLKQARLEVADDEAPERATITATVDRLDAWAFERARLMVEAVGARPGDEAIEAMLAEGLTEILAQNADVDLPLGIAGSPEREARSARLEVAELHERCLAGVDRIKCHEPVEYTPEEEIAWAEDVTGVDGQLRELARALAWRDLELAALGRRADEGSVWRACGYVSFDHYCRERIGLAPSTMATRVAFARRVAELGPLDDAVAGGRIGWEAASAIGRVASPATVGAWIARAEERTVRQLREEIGAAEMLARAEGRSLREVPPPDAETLETLHAIERGVIAAVTGVEEIEGQMSGTEPAGVAKTTLRLSVSPETAAFWHALEGVHAFERSNPDESFVAFLVRSVMKSWRGALPAEVEYADVYLRDRWRCASPVCGSANVTPHHVVFRSRGGGEERSNLISLCARCHLELVHGGHLEVAGRAPDALRWSAEGWSTRSAHRAMSPSGPRADGRGNERCDIGDA